MAATIGQAADGDRGIGDRARPEGSDGFYEDLPSFDAFASVTDPDCYRPLPGDWTVGLADVVASGRAIADGRYKAVNTVGAAVIAGVSNALPARAFPFAFGGDGASFAVPSRHVDVVREVLARTAAWSEDALGLELRVAAIPVGEIRREGFDVRVARYRIGRQISYAMFSGGGLAWAEERLKQGAYRLGRAAPGSAPDLEGLTCGFATIGSVRGVILSVIVVPVVDGPAFARLVDEVVALIEAADAGGPVRLSVRDPGFEGSSLSAAVALGQARGPLRPQAEGAEARERPSGPAQPSAALASARPLEKAASDTDFRKFDDGLRMTVDCEPAVADAIERVLAAAQEAGTCRFGTHRQDAANLTCLLPSNHSRHAHFVDGADGGYAAAAAKLKSGSGNRG